jgi:DNA-binding IclR family transcriptional regulator
MHAAEPGTDVPSATTSRGREYRGPEPSRFLTPRPRRARSRPRTAVRSQPVPVRMDRQRARRLVTAAEALRAFRFERLGLPGSDGRAAFAREVIADHMQDSEACQLEAFDQALALAAERAGLAFCAQDGWLESLRAGLSALLEFFDEEPTLARYLIVHSAQSGEAVLTRRREVLDRIAVLLDDERAPARSYPPPLTAGAIANGVLGVLSERLSESHPGPLTELANPLMSFIVLPFLGTRAARRELAGRPTVADGAADVDIPKDAGRVNGRASLLLSVIAAEPGLNSRELAARSGVSDGGYASRLLARLERLGLIKNDRNSDSRFGAKVWTITATGERVRDAIERAAATPEPTSSFDLPPEFVGRLDDRAVSMLRVIVDQPWLRGSEVAERAGLKDATEVKSLLEGLVDLGLAASEREARGRGAPKVWQVSPAGEQLVEAIGRDAPPVSRSVALDLMHRCGGRLSGTAESVLRVIGSEPGLSNNDIALRVGLTDENTASQQLARLARRDLIVNDRKGGRFNVWHLTPAGERLERAIWSETPLAKQRRLALGLVRDRGGRLNHRLVEVLRVIGAEPELSNREIAERVGIEGKGHASMLLARAARFGLVENVVVDPLPFEANAWQLTASGRELEAAIQREREHV